MGLRRYRSSREESNPCPLPRRRYHDALVYIGREKTTRNDEHYTNLHHAEEFAGDVRWPTHCACGYEFLEDDEWQVTCNAMYTDGHRMWNRVYDLPAGALFNAFWRHGHFGERPGPDGIIWNLMLPPNGSGTLWCIDGPSTGENPGYWTRTGAAPNFTITPSILTGQYHGHVTDGVLTDSLPDRPLP